MSNHTLFERSLLWLFSHYTAVCLVAKKTAYWTQANDLIVSHVYNTGKTGNFFLHTAHMFLKLTVFSLRYSFTVKLMG